MEVCESSERREEERGWSWTESDEQSGNESATETEQMAIGEEEVGRKRHRLIESFKTMLFVLGTAVVVVVACRNTLTQYVPSFAIIQVAGLPKSEKKVRKKINKIASLKCERL